MLHEFFKLNKIYSFLADTDKVQQQDDYDELLERLRVADFLYTEYSLEEVIYQLAKVMFTQSLTRGSTEAQQALQKFTNFLEMEAEQGHISRALEKKVLGKLCMYKRCKVHYIIIKKRTVKWNCKLSFNLSAFFTYFCITLLRLI